MSERSESNGGGGNRTPVPRRFGTSFYVRSQSFKFRRRQLRRTGFVIG